MDLLVYEIGSDDPPRNIAVSGPYGSGKSSVLTELRRRLPGGSVVEIELATVDRDTSAIAGRARTTTSGPVVTEALQKEVVKRLLYAAKPSRLPRSQLNRIRPFSTRRAALISAIFALGYLVAEWVYSVPGPAIKWALSWVAPPLNMNLEFWHALAHVLDAAIVFGLVIASQWALSLIRVREVSVGEFKLSKEDSAQNPFDQYLDEIVYFFATTGKKVVVFEDLDRFRDRGIFIALRELNILLNNSDAVPQAVTFVYATGDKVFAPRKNRQGAKGVSAPGSDRAKFFDLIVPVVPFVSTETAGGLLTRQFTLHDTASPDPELIRLIGRYFPDMRAIISLSNEYQVFFDRLIRHGRLKLDKNKLFAMVAYKHAFPKDYDAIQFGSSRLEASIALIDRLTRRRLRGMDREIRDLRSDIDQRENEAVRAEAAGNNLRSALGVFVLPGARPDIDQITFGVNTFPYTEVDTIKFWEALDASALDDLTLTFTAGGPVRVHRAALATALPMDLPASNWLAQTKSNADGRLARLLANRGSLAHANLAETLTNRAFIGLADSEDGHSLVTIDFKGAVDKLLGSDFALELLTSGYLDETYVLYGSVYEGSLVSIEAQNFRIQYVARRRSSPLYALSAKDLSEIRAKVGDSFLDEPSVLNVSIFDHLLEGPDLDSAIGLIAEGRLDQDRKFLTTYLAQGEHVELLAAKLAARAGWILSFLARSALTPATAQRAFDSALSALAPATDYEVDATCAPFLSVSATSALGGRGAAVGPATSGVISQLFSDEGIRVPHLNDWSLAARDALSDSGAFEMNRENLAAISGSQVSIGLDSVGRRPLVLHHLLSRLAEYVEVLDESRRPSLDDEDDFDGLLAVVASAGASELRAVLSRAPRTAAIEDLIGFDPGLASELVAIYPVLAEFDFFRPTSSNVGRYLEARGVLDPALEAFLTRNRLVDEGSLTAEQRLSIARALAGATSIPTERLASLLEDLQMAQIDLRGVRLERPEVAQMLVREGHLTVDSSTWSSLAKTPWKVKEAILATASVDEIGALPLAPDELELTLASRVVPLQLKRTLIESPSQLSHVTTPKGATEAARLATELRVPLANDQIIALIDAGAAPSTMIGYLVLQDMSIDDRGLVAALVALGGQWAALVDHSSHWKNYDLSPSLELLIDRLKRLGYITKATVQGKSVRVTFAS